MTTSTGTNAHLTHPHFCTLIGNRNVGGEGMERRSFLGSSAALVGSQMLRSGYSQKNEVHVHHARAASLITECANRFLAALDADQRGKATFAFDADERLNRHF